ncbi:MAG TPA: FAD binding domain-containing protein [Thermoanaerobaculia bacterium]|nr:FAD binding domain-containing protein [Thermoanaerobaculia bacterium]
MIAFSPTTLDEALAALRDEPRLLPVAGCTDLMVRPPLSRLALDRLLDLTRIPGLAALEERQEGLAIGAATTFSTLGAHPLVVEHFPALAAAARTIGGWQIQNRATLGGNAANASPAGDSLPVLLALGATVEVAGAGGRRSIPYDRFHVAYRRTALRQGEIATAFLLPWPGAGEHQGFRKVGTRQAQAISKVVVALSAAVEEGRVARLRLAAGSVAATPVRLPRAEAAALGKPLAEAAEAAGAAAAAEVTPIDDVRSTAEYRRWVLGRVVRRLLLSLDSPR